MSFVTDSNSRLRAVGVAAGVGIAGIVVAVVLSALAGVLLLFSGIEVTPTVQITVSLLVGPGLAFMGTAYGYLRWRGLPLKAVGLHVPTLRNLAVGGGVFVLSILYLIAASFILQQTGTQAASNNAAELAMENPEIILVLIPASYLLIGPGEELLFRGVVQGRMRENLSAIPAILIAGFIFAFIHMMSLQAGAPLSAKLVTITLLMGPSIAFGAVYEYTGNIVIPALLHGTYDAFLFAMLYLVVTGGVEPAVLF